MDPSNKHQFWPYLSVSVRSLTIIAEKQAPPKKKGKFIFNALPISKKLEHYSSPSSFCFLTPKKMNTSQSTSFKLVLKHAIKPAFHGHVSPWPPRVGGFELLTAMAGRSLPCLPKK